MIDLPPDDIARCTKATGCGWAAFCVRALPPRDGHRATYVTPFAPAPRCDEYIPRNPNRRGDP